MGAVIYQLTGVGRGGGVGEGTASALVVSVNNLLDVIEGVQWYTKAKFLAPDWGI
jgi:hypothetical protein